ncbi:MAG: hypothetical protein QW356_07475 [Candidatus Hadarchaeales archaeon]
MKTQSSSADIKLEAATLWLGYNVGYFCFRSHFEKARKLSEEFFYFFQNLSRLGLKDSDIWKEAEEVAQKVGQEEVLLKPEIAEEISEKAFEWKKRLSNAVQKREAFWAGYNLIYLISQNRRASAGEISRELFYLQQNLKSLGWATDILKQVESALQEIQPLAQAVPLPEESARKLEENCLNWRAKILSILGE